MTKTLLLPLMVVATLAQSDRSAKAFALQEDNATAQLLSELIRVNTSNPPGHEEQIARLLETKFKPLGFDISIVPTPEPGKASFFGREPR
jgi:acetylornithine deacetylase/succinyl-diaminopimelate desuccinylase-like protein